MQSLPLEANKREINVFEGTSETPIHIIQPSNIFTFIIPKYQLPNIVIVVQSIKTTSMQN